MSLNVYFQTLDVAWLRGLVFDYIRGNGTLEPLRSPLRRQWDIARTVAPWRRMASEAHREARDELPPGFDFRAFESRPYFIVEDQPERVAELMDLYHNAPDDETVIRLIRSQLAILVPNSIDAPGRWAPKPVEWRWDVEKQVERSMARLIPYAAPPGGNRRKELDHEFASAVLELNEDLQPVAEIYDYPLGTVKSWATAEFRECLEPSDDLFRPLFAEHPQLEKSLGSKRRYYPSCCGAGLYVRPANALKALRAIEASLLRAEEWSSQDEFAIGALEKLAWLLGYAQRRGLGLIERCS